MTASNATTPAACPAPLAMSAPVPSGSPSGSADGRRRRQTPPSHGAARSRRPRRAIAPRLERRSDQAACPVRSRVQHRLPPRRQRLRPDHPALRRRRRRPRHAQRRHVGDRRRQQRRSPGLAAQPSTSPTSPPRCSASTRADWRGAPGGRTPTVRTSRWPTRPATSTWSRSCRAAPLVAAAAVGPRRRPRVRRIGHDARLRRQAGDLQLPGRAGPHGAAADRRGVRPQHRRADTVPGNVTLRLINVPWDQALEIVLRAKGLDQRRDGNVVWVAPQSELAVRAGAGRRAHRAGELRRAGHRVHPDQLRQRRGHRDAPDRRERRRRRRRRRGWRRQQPRLPLGARQRQRRHPHQHAAGQRHAQEDRRDRACSRCSTARSTRC